jgi:hypothetical protein
MRWRGRERLMNVEDRGRAFEGSVHGRQACADQDREKWEPNDTQNSKFQKRKTPPVHGKPTPCDARVSGPSLSFHSDAPVSVRPFRLMFSFRNGRQRN